jgi:hypothetical protein
MASLFNFFNAFQNMLDKISSLNNRYNTMMTSDSFVLGGWFNHDIPGLAGRYIILSAKPGRFLIFP